MDVIGPKLEIETTESGSRPVMVVKGEIDLKTSADFETALDRYSDAELILDLRGVEFIDSSGLRVLIKIRRRLEEAGGRLFLLAPDGPVRRILSLAGLTEDFDFVTSLEELPEG